MKAFKTMICCYLLVAGILYLHAEEIEQQKIAAIKLQRTQEELRQYENSPEGQDEIARKQSQDGRITLSKTGKKYYRGLYCTKDCSGHQSGYEWATKLGVTNEDACDTRNKSKSFTEGCLKGVEDTLDDLRSYFREQYPEDCEEDEEDFPTDEYRHERYD
jgi:hypothetical protein